MAPEKRGPYKDRAYVPSDLGSREFGGDYNRIWEVASVEHPKIDIVFVHGLGSKWVQTWRSPNQTTWLQDLLPGELPPSRIMTTGFNVLQRIDSNMHSFERGSAKFIEDLEENRPDKSRPIIFVGHSLGGLIIQQALSQSATASLKECIKGIIFLATPHFGNDSLAWKGFWKKIGKIIDGTEPQYASEPWLQHELGMINVHFYDWLKTQTFRQHVFCFYEGLPMYRMGTLIKGSHVGNDFGVDKCVLSANHLNIAKFDEPADPNYQIVLKRIKSMYNYKEPLAESPMVSFQLRARTETSDSQMSAPDAREDILDSNKVSDSVKLALALEDQGHYKAAEDAYKEAIEDYKSSLGASDRLTLYCMDKLASLLRDRSEYDEAARLSQEVLSTRIAHQGLEDSATLSSAGNLAMIMRYQSKQQEAFSMLRNALENTEMKPLGSITRTRIVSVLAKFFRDHGSYDLAELLSRDVAQASSLWLGDDHPFTLNRQSDLSVACSTHPVNNCFLTAEDISRQALDGLEKTLGRDHPNALRTSRRLGNFFRFQGEYDYACKKLETTLARQKEQIGVHHPSTLSTMTGLAAVCVLQGYIRDGRATLEEALAGQIELLGTEHQNTVWTQTALRLLVDVPDEEELDNANASSVKADPKLVEYFGVPSKIRRPISLEPVPSLWHSAYADEIAIITAMSQNDRETVEKLLKDVTDLNVLGRALRAASYSGKDVIIPLLLDHGAPVDSKGGFYGTALQAAADAGNLSTVQLLIENHARVNDQGGLFNTALRAATFRGHNKIIELLLAHGADPNKHDVGSISTTLQVAVSRGDASTVRALLEARADPNAGDHLFGTALQEASFKGSLDIVELLLQHGADPNILGGLYGSAMQAALRASHREVVKKLIESGADASSYNMLHAILESGMDLVDVSFGRRVSDLFVMEPKFSERANTAKLRFGVRNEVVKETKDEVVVMRDRPPPKPKNKALAKEAKRDNSRNRRSSKWKLF